MISSTLDKEAIQNQVLGRTLQLDQVVQGFELGRDLVFTAGPNGTDFGWVSGLDCLVQALRMALTTALGSDIFNVNFGFDGLNAIAEETDPILMRERIRISIVKVLQRDPRIRRIVDVKLIDGRLSPSESGSLATASIDPAVPSRTLTVIVSFEVVTGSTLTVSLGSVNPNG